MRSFDKRLLIALLTVLALVRPVCDVGASFVAIDNTEFSNLLEFEVPPSGNLMLSTSEDIYVSAPNGINANLIDLTAELSISIEIILAADQIFLTAGTDIFLPEDTDIVLTGETNLVTTGGAGTDVVLTTGTGVVTTGGAGAGVVFVGGTVEVITEGPVLLPLIDPSLEFLFASDPLIQGATSYTFDRDLIVAVPNDSIGDLTLLAGGSIIVSSQVIPEPSTMSFLALGCCVFVASYRFRSSSRQLRG